MSSTFPSIGFIGAGNMAQAIGMRLVNEGLIKPSDMTVSAKTDRNLKRWSEKGVNTTTNNCTNLVEVVKKAEIVFIAVKPQFFEEAIKSLLGEWDDAFRIFVSVMAGKTIDFVKENIKKFSPSITKFDVIRIMPSTPCLVGKGCSVLCHGPNVPEEYVLKIQKIMSYTGTCDLVSEHLVDAVSAVSASGPAYLYLVIESLADGAVRCGVPRHLALKFASQAVIGAGEMVIRTEKHPGELKDAVCTPGGSTITGVHELEKAGLRCAFMNAVLAATNRSAELFKITQK